MLLPTDRDITALPTRTFRREVRWRGIAMVFQGAMHALNPVIRVGDQVAERLRSDGMGLGDARRAWSTSCWGAWGCRPGRRERYPHELSGGMKQRVMIAMALTHDPPLLILDEPTSALDVSIQAQIMNLLKELKWERGISMLFITHDLALASDLCDRIAVVYAGQVRELTAPRTRCWPTPRDPYTRGLLASIPRLHGDAMPALPARARRRTCASRRPAAASRRAARWCSSDAREPPPLFEVGAGSSRALLAAEVPA